MQKTVHFRLLTFALALTAVPGAFLSCRPCAAAQAKPDIALSGLTIAQETVQEGVKVKVNFTPKVTGKLDKEFQCDVYLTNQLTGSPTGIKIARVTVKPSGSTALCAICAEYTTSVPTLATLQYALVVADPDDVIAEANERNNRSAKFLR